MTWNCNGLAEYKRNNSEFRDILTANDIIFLLESWTDVDSDIDLSGYTCFNFYRKFKHKKAKRNSGGIVVYIKDCVKCGVTVVRSHHDTIVWLKLAKTFFSFARDMYVCGSYIWGDDSPANRYVDADLFQLLQDDINYFQELGRIFVTGDFNGRVGHRLDYIAHDALNSATDNVLYIPDVPLDRVSQDSVTNAHGNSLLDLCKATSLRIANGRLGADKHNGAYTYFSRNGSSVIDYLLLNYNDFEYVQSFAIQNFTEFSDHAPLSFSLHTRGRRNMEGINGDTEQVYFRWDEKLLPDFRRGLISKLPDLNIILENANSYERESVSEAVSKFVHVIRDVADPLFEHKRNSTSGKFTKSCMFDSKFFDDQCRASKREYTRALFAYNANSCHVNRL
ncbi:MAG: endonuclease/exonuclease/phosphatase family protein, partial [Sedimenticola sp.]